VEDKSSLISASIFFSVAIISFGLGIIVIIPTLLFRKVDPKELHKKFVFTGIQFLISGLSMGLVGFLFCSNASLWLILAGFIICYIIVTYFDRERWKRFK
jgi:hypothetical protein